MCSSNAPPLDNLAEVIAAFAREDPLRLPGDALTEELVELRRLLDAIEAAFTSHVGALDRTRAYAPSGALSAASWLRSACRLSAPDAAECVRVARQRLAGAPAAR